MMKRGLFRAVGLLALSFGIANAAPASLVDGVGGASITKYNVTITKLESYNSEKGMYVTLSETPTTVNIASATAGSDIAAMVANATIPYGTYTQTRVTIANTFTINACIDGARCTSGSRFTLGTAFQNALLALANTASASRADTAITIDFSDASLSGVLAGANAVATSGGVQVVYSHPTPLVVNQDTTSFSVGVDFDLGGGVFKYDNPGGQDVIYVNFPTVNITF